MKDNKEDNNLIKSYKLLAIWFLLFFIFAGVFSALLIILDLNLSPKVTTLIWLCCTNLFLISFFFMVYKTERVYYINYIPYKMAQEATKEERKAFAYKHLKVFSIATIISIIYLIISLVFQYSIGVDVGVWTVIIIISAIKTIPFRLKNK